METRLLDALEQIREGIQIVGFDWRYLYLNAAAERHGRQPRTALIGRTMMECNPGIDETPLFEHLRACMADRVSLDLVNTFTYPDGSARWFELHIEPVPEGLLIFSVDVTDRHALETQLRQSQKMEAVGRLAGGIAHDFNNLLTIVTAAGEMARDSLGPDHPAHADVTDILDAATRATRLVKQLLTFSRRQPTSPRLVDLNMLVATLRALLVRALGESVVLRTEPARGIWPVNIDPSALEQVIVNLSVNARDAMNGIGTLTVATENTTIDAVGSLAQGGLVAPGEYVVLTVSDTGPGIDERTRERLFEPFFTTKPPGEGTGLGLSTCFGIVKQAGGNIGVSSEPGCGATFRVYLPRAVGVAPADTETRTERSHAGTEAILVVEDNEVVRRHACRALRNAGYEVFEADGGAAALALVERADVAFHLLVTDVMMPGIDGRELARRFRQVRPTIKVMYVSGYSGDVAVEDPATRLLQKPYTPDQLTREVRAVLDER